MPDNPAVFDGSIPANYDRYLGPCLFEPYAADLVRRAAGRAGAEVLEIACGTGIVTRQLRERLPRDARLVATDLNEPMLEYARAKPPRATGIEWRPADAAALPFPDRCFDLVVCQFGLMFVPDKAAALREARRVLRPGGKLLFNVWDSLAENPFGRIAHETIARFFPVDPPTFYFVPFGYFDREVLRRLPVEVGFDDARLEVVALEGRSPSARDLATGLVLGNPVATAIRDRGGVPAETVRAAVADALARECGDHPVRVRMQAIVVEASCRAAG